MCIRKNLCPWSHLWPLALKIFLTSLLPRCLIIEGKNLLEVFKVSHSLCIIHLWVSVLFPSIARGFYDGIYLALLFFSFLFVILSVGFVLFFRKNTGRGMRRRRESWMCWGWEKDYKTHCKIILNKIEIKIKHRGNERSG